MVRNRIKYNRSAFWNKIFKQPGWVCGWWRKWLWWKLFYPIGAVILKTTDGGHTWNQMPLNLSDKIELKAIHYINDSVGFTIGISAILKTSDAGNTWEQIKFENLGGAMQKISLMGVLE
ncbi:MAG: hypothetical protein H0X62_00240 [Bacteroidetes bacterium]|nr:hypothetical protein [Bacteroidota bacterium]